MFKSIWMSAGIAATAAMIATSSPAVVADPAPRTMTIQMHGLNGSGQDGTAILTESGSKVRVTISIGGEPATASEPAHVHFGRCPNIKAIPAYNVGPVVGGKATDVVELTWAEITSGKYAVNVHQSTALLGRYVSCGNIGESATPVPLPTEDSGY